MIDPQKLLEGILGNAKKDAIRMEVTNELLRDVYGELCLSLYTREYVQYMKENGGDAYKVEQDLDEVAKAVHLIAEMEEVPFLDAFHKYLEDMDINLPDYAKIKEHIQKLDMNAISEMSFKFDPFENLERKGAVITQKLRDDIRKLIAAAGKVLTREKLDQIPEFVQYVKTVQERSFTYMAAEGMPAFFMERRLKEALKRHE